MKEKDYLALSPEVAARTWTEEERAADRAAEIYSVSVSIPRGRILLIQEGDFLCALRFTNFVRGKDAHASSVWSSGEETLTSVYDWAVLASLDGGLRPQQQGSAIVQFTAPHGFGHLIVGGGWGNLTCGPHSYAWRYPSAVQFSTAAEPRMRMAPTRWTTIDEIRLDEPKLRWFERDGHRTIESPRPRDLEEQEGRIGPKISAPGASESTKASE